MTRNQAAQKTVEAALENLRQTSFIPFWAPSKDVTPDREVHAWMEMLEWSYKRALEALQESVSGRQFESFSLKLKEGRRRYYDIPGRPELLVTANDGFEWEQVFAEAWAGVANPNDWLLTDNAVRMLEWLKGSKNTGALAPVNRVGRQAGLRGGGSYAKMGIYFEEIAIKSPYGVDFEITSRWNGDVRGKLVEKKKGLAPLAWRNPAFSGKIIDADPSSWSAFAQMLEDRVLEGSPDNDDEPIILLRCHSRSELLECLPGVKEIESDLPYRVREFLGKVRLSPGMKIAADLEGRPDKGWRIGVVLEKDWTWDGARESIRRQREREDPRTTYGLSDRAARLIEWVWNLHENEWMMGMTPSVEPAAKEQVGIGNLESDRNSRAILELLVEEINEKTPFLWRLIPWSDYRCQHHRILVRKKRNREEELVRQIQLLGLEKGVSVSAETVAEALGGLWMQGAPSDRGG